MDNSFEHEHCIYCGAEKGGYIELYVSIRKRLKELIRIMKRLNDLEGPTHEEIQEINIEGMVSGIEKTKRDIMNCLRLSRVFSDDDVEKGCLQAGRKVKRIHRNLQEKKKSYEMMMDYYRIDRDLQLIKESDKDVFSGRKEMKSIKKKLRTTERYIDESTDSEFMDRFQTIREEYDFINEKITSSIRSGDIQSLSELFNDDDEIDFEIEFDENTAYIENKTIKPKRTYQSFLTTSDYKDIKDGTEDLIEKYTITHKIGTGGFATVYRAEDPNGKPVALKLSRVIDETMDESSINKFVEEAKIWKKLKHKNIVKFHEFDTLPLPYICIELLEGGNLRQLMNRRKLEIGEAVDIMLQLLSGISYAHRMATVHRDIKPENILFTKKGTAKLSDWGIGKFMASEASTRSIGTKGTLSYSAPEQISKKKYGAVDWQTDIFQMGIVFYEVLTGMNPFIDDDPIGIMGKITNEDPDPPSSINPEIPPEIDNIVMGALRKRKEDRWRSADVMYDRLREIVDGTS